MPTYEGLRLRLLKIKRVKLAASRRKKLTNEDFTIISNNCWGGMIYESYNLPKNSPTVGMFFMAEDYIRFLARLKEYLSAELTFIEPKNSAWKNAEQVSGDKRFGTYPIGLLSLGDESIEVFFLHYHSEEEAREKWMRRCERVNWSNLLIKFNDQNGCTKELVERYMQLPFKNKLFFTCREWEGVPKENYIRIRQLSRKEFILASYEPFGKSRYADITRILNNLQAEENL